MAPALPLPLTLYSLRVGLASHPASHGRCCSLLFHPRPRVGSPHCEQNPGLCFTGREACRLRHPTGSAGSGMGGSVATLPSAPQSVYLEFLYSRVYQWSPSENRVRRRERVEPPGGSPGGGGPREHRGVDDGAQLLDGGAIAGLDGEALQHRGVERGELLHGSGPGELSRGDSSLEPALQRALAAQPVLREERPDRRVLRCAQERRQDNHAPSGLVSGGIGPRIGAQHVLHRRARGGRLLQAAGDVEALGPVVELHRLPEEVLLAAEDGIEAGLVDAHRLDEVLDGRALVATGPEDAHGLDERLVTVEPSGPSHHGGGLLLLRLLRRHPSMALKPATPMPINTRQTMRATETCSPRNTMPQTATPAAPMPTQTA